MMDELIRRLHAGGHSLTVFRGGFRAFDGRGVSDLYRLLSGGSGLLRGALVADKVVGKAAAALMILAGVKEAYADIVSLPALELFNRAGVRIRYAETTPRIVNRAKTGWCPLESRCFDCSTPQACLERIEAFMKQSEETRPVSGIPT